MHGSRDFEPSPLRRDEGVDQPGGGFVERALLKRLAIRFDRGGHLRKIAFEHRSHLVTGATAGIGKALVERLAAEGRNVIAAARDPARARIANGPGRVETVRLDFDEPSTVEAAAREVTRIAGAAGLAGLVNMAGIIVEGPLEAIPTQALRRQFEVNVIGPVALTQALLPMLAKARGAVVNIGAVSAASDAAVLWPDRRVEGRSGVP